MSGSKRPRGTRDGGRYKRLQAVRRANDRHLAEQYDQESFGLDMCECPSCGLRQRARLAWEHSHSDGGEASWTLNAYCATCDRWLRQYKMRDHRTKAMAMRRGLDWRGP